MGDVLAFCGDTDVDRHDADDDGGNTCCNHLLLRGSMVALDDADVDVVRHRGSGGQHQARNHCNDGGECNGSNEGEEQVAEYGIGAATGELRQHRSGHVAALVERGDGAGANVDRGAHAQEQGQDIETAYDAHCPQHGSTRGLSRRNGEEAHQDVRHTGGAEHQGHAQGDLVNRILQEQTGLQETLTEFFRRHGGRGIADQLGDLRLHLGIADHGGEEAGQAEAVLAPGDEHQQDGRGHQQHGLDDLHPGSGLHAAEHHIGQHQHADADHGDVIVDADQGLDQHAAADHLRGQVEGGHGNGGQCRDGLGGFRIVAEGQDVTQRVLADVAARLGDHQQHGDVSHQPAHRVHEAVITVKGDQAGDAEEGRGGQVVAGDRPAVLDAGYRATGGVELGGGVGGFRGPERHIHGHGDDQAEHGEGHPLEFVGHSAGASKGDRTTKGEGGGSANQFQVHGIVLI